jgi:type II secretion system protein G
VFRSIVKKYQVIQDKLVEKGQEGVTLIELLVVIVILGVIAAIAVPVVTNAVTNSKVNTTKQNMAIVVDALNRYAADHDGDFPKQESKGSLPSNLTTNDANGGPYLGSIPQDGYGATFNYTSNGTTFSVTGTNMTADSSNETPH